MSNECSCFSENFLAKTGIFETCRRAREGRIAKRFSGGRPSSRRSMSVFPPVRSVVGVSLSAPRSGALVIWKGKKVFCLATMGAFSGDGAGCSARLLKKYGATVLGGLHLKMPDSVCDSKLLKKSKEEKIEIIRRAEEKIERAVLQIRSGKYPQNGLGFFPHLVGLLGQRLWFYGKTRSYSDKLKINKGRCVGCGVCESICPMKNLTIENQIATPHGKCTMCYRCISECPQQAITLVGKEVVEQYRLENFIS